MDNPGGVLFGRNLTLAQREIPPVPCKGKGRSPLRAAEPPPARKGLRALPPILAAPHGGQRLDQPVEGVWFGFEDRLQPQRRERLGSLGTDGGGLQLRELAH